MEAEHQGSVPVDAAPPEPQISWYDVVEAMPQLVWVAGDDGRVHFYNERVHTYSGPFRGGDGTWQWRPLVHVDDADATAAAWEHAVAHGTPYACEHRIRMADGSYRWHVSRAIPATQSDGSVAWIGTATDIHDRALAEQRARRSEQRLARLIDGLFTFVGLCSPDGTLLEANETALQVGGLTRDDVIGKPLWDAYWWSHDPDAQARLRAAIRRAAAGSASRWDADVRVAGGRRLTIDFQLVPLVEDGQVTGLIPSGSDIDDRIADRRRLEALARLSHELNGVSGTPDVGQLICRHGPAAVDASFVNVGVVDEHRLALQLIHPDGDEDLARRWPSLPLDGSETPYHDVMASGEAIYLDDAQRRERYPGTVEDAERLGVSASAALPLRDSSGTVFGVLGCGWADEVEVDAAVRARLHLLADLCSQALERSHRSDVHDRLVHQLQDRLLTGEDVASQLDLAVGYEPAQTTIGFGGDWYDVVAVDDDVTALVVGDVAGHGIDAAAEMATTKATVRATILSAPSRADVLPVASRALGHLGSGYVATVAAAWVDTSRGTLEWRLAGHPPPVLRTPGTPARLLEGAHHPPLGMPTAPRAGSTEPFPPGSVLVLYTDGLVERPDQDLDDRLEALRALADELPDGLNAAEVRDRLMRELLEARAIDDVAIVVAVRPA